jgi:hypothetical protein
MMDAYKCAVINQDSIRDLVNHVGFDEFVNFFTKLCFNDPALSQFI